MRLVVTPLVALSAALILALGPADPGITKDRPIVDLFDVADSAATGSTGVEGDAASPAPEP